jgi:DHA2 family multidrug resistance protein-like MFS transporter
MPIVVDMTILHIAVPSLTLGLGASGTEVLWIIDIYPLMMAGLLVPMGTLSDRVGHRRMLLTGLVVFLLASLAAAFSPTAGALIASRILLAIGASMVMPNVLAIIRQTFEDPKERGIALGLWGTVGSAGAALGPLGGGALLEHFWWGSVFLINVPVMLVVWPLAYACLPRRVPSAKGRWTMGQALVLIVGLIATIYAIKSGFKAGSSPLVTGLTLTMGLGFIALFVRQQIRSAAPMLDLSLFSKPAISVGMVMALVVSGSLTGVELTVAQELQFVVGYTPLQAGLFMMPLVIGSALGGPFAGYATAMFGLRNVAALALLTAAGSLAGLGQSDFHEPGFAVIALLATLGIALSVGLTASSIAIMGSAPAEKAGAAGSLEGTGYELGAGLGITFFALDKLCRGHRLARGSTQRYRCQRYAFHRRHHGCGRSFGFGRRRPRRGRSNGLFQCACHRPDDCSKPHCPIGGRGLCRPEELSRTTTPASALSDNGPAGLLARSVAGNAPRIGRVSATLFRVPAAKRGHWRQGPD